MSKKSVGLSDGGWIKLHRKMLDSPLFNGKPHSWLTVWITILLSANWKEGTFFDGYETVTVPPGSWVTSEEKLAAHARTNRATIRCFFRFVERTKAATIRRTKRWTMLTITNWATYQALIQPGEPTGEPTPEPTDGVVDSKDTAHDTAHERTIIEEVKNKRIEHMSNSGELDSPATPRSKRSKTQIDPDVEAWFETEFWPAYPRHEGKANSLRAAAAKATTPEKRSHYLTRLKAQLPGYLQRKAESGQRVVPLASTWFNQDKSEDQIEVFEPRPDRNRPTPQYIDYPEYVPV